MEQVDSLTTKAGLPMVDKERFIRWQAILREHLSYTINLLLTFSVAALGYSLSLIRDHAFNPTGLFLYVFWIALVSLWLSICLGIFCIFNRLSDFRATAQRAKQAATGPADRGQYIDMLGKLTWGWFYAQAIFFGVGATALGIVILHEYGQRLL
jgi:hypothetical protein